MSIEKMFADIGYKPEGNAWKCGDTAIYFDEGGAVMKLFGSDDILEPFTPDEIHAVNALLNAEEQVACDGKFWFEKYVAHSWPMPDGLNIVDQYAFHILSAIYGQYRNGAVSRDEASRKKKELWVAYDKAKKHLDNENRLYLYHCQLRTEIEGAQNRFRKDPTVENAMALSKVLDGVLEVKGDGQLRRDVQRRRG